MSDPVVLLSTGDVVGPAGGVTDNSMVLFSGTSGKLIKGNNAQVTSAGLALLDDVNAAAQKVTLGLGNVDNTSDIDKPISTATQTALNLKATIASPTFTGTPTAPTATAGTNTTQLATTDFVTTADNLKANINSPAFTGTPTAPTPSIGTRSTAIATMQNFADEFGSSPATNGYQKLPSGLIIQWGITVGSANATDYKYFPVAFPNACLQGLASYPNYPSWGQGCGFGVISRQQFIATGYVSNGASSTAIVRWFAIGY